jgi:hypothetical protein
VIDGFNYNLIYYLEMEEIKEDIKQLEQDVEKIQCEPIITFFKDLLKCIKDCLSYFFKPKV